MNWKATLYLCALVTTRLKPGESFGAHGKEARPAAQSTPLIAFNLENKGNLTVRVELRVVDTKTINTSFSELAAANGQIGLEKLIFGESKPDHKALLDGLQCWPYGTLDPQLAFMDDSGIRYNAYRGGVDNWIKPILDSEDPEAKALQNDFIGWGWPGRPRDVEDYSEELTKSAGLFCYAVHRGTETDELKVIACNFARMLKRPVAWFCDGQLSLREVNYAREHFKDYPNITVMADDRYLRSAVFAFADIVRKSLPPRSAKNTAARAV